MKKIYLGLLGLILIPAPAAPTTDSDAAPTFF